MEIKIGYALAKPVETQAQCDAYTAMVEAVNAHNAACAVGGTLWEIADKDACYEIVAAGTKAAQEEALRSKKLEEVSNCCEKTICAGIDVTFTDGTQEHFSLETSDQTNIDSVFNSVVMGATEYPYHADGEPCKMYSAADIITLYMSEKSFITKQTTYNNALRQWIKRETDKDVLKAIKYGDALPDDLAAKMTDILAKANEQVQAIVSKLTVAISTE